MGPSGLAWPEGKAGEMAGEVGKNLKPVQFQRDLAPRNFPGHLLKDQWLGGPGLARGSLVSGKVVFLMQGWLLRSIDDPYQSDEQRRQVHDRSRMERTVKVITPLPFLLLEFPLQHHCQALLSQGTYSLLE